MRLLFPANIFFFAVCMATRYLELTGFLSAQPLNVPWFESVGFLGEYKTEAAVSQLGFVEQTQTTIIVSDVQVHWLTFTLQYSCHVRPQWRPVSERGSKFSVLLLLFPIFVTVDNRATSSQTVASVLMLHRVTLSLTKNQNERHYFFTGQILVARV